ncbi:DUF2813 domain-containing protein [Thermococcus sp. 21S9]|nr:DUF2813 domain-containing protein [Thermococcus sp. 21S9]
MSTLRLIGLKIKNYRSIKELPEDKEYQEIENFVTIIGKNDAGKSNILNAIRIVLENVRVTKEDFHKNTNENIEISLIFDVTDNDEIMRGINSSGNLPRGQGLEAFFNKSYKQNPKNSKIKIKRIFEKEKLKGRNYKGETVVEYFDESKNKWTKIENKGLIRTILHALPEVIYISAIRDVIEETTQKSGFLMSKLLSPILEKQSEKNRDNEQKSIVELKKELQDAIRKESKKLEEIILAEMAVFSDSIEKIEIEPNKLQINFSPRIRIKDKHLPNGVPLEQRGAGLRSEFLLAMFRAWAEIGAGKGYIILFEEPELYLHPEAQKKMFYALKRISNEAQVLLTTHSTIFVDRSDLKSIWLIQRENGETKIKTFEKAEGLSEILEEIGAAPSDLFLSNGIIYVEGKTEIKVFNKIAKAICPKWEEYNIAIISLGGNNIYDLSDTLLSNGFASLTPNAIIVVDSDGSEIDDNGNCKPEPKKLEIKEKFEKYGITVHILKKREIENYILPEIIEKYFTEGYINSKYKTKLKDHPRDIGNKIEKYFERKYFNYFKKIEARLRKLEEKHNELKAMTISPCQDIVKSVDKLLSRKKWNDEKAEITPKLFEMMLKEKKVPSEFREILEKAIRKCGFEPEFSDEFDYIH